MQYNRVCVESMAYVLPQEVVTSDDIEQQLSPVYDKLGLPAGRLELMTGIQERRFFPMGTKPGKVSAQTANLAWQASGLNSTDCGALLHGSVCRDQMEPATANMVHHFTTLPDNSLVLDISNACLGILNGIHLLANMIELKQIRAGIVVGTETGRTLVENTIHKLLHTESITRQSIKQEFASLTIGSASAAVVLCDEELSEHHSYLRGGLWKNDTKAHTLCAGGDLSQDGGTNGLSMHTDSEALLHAGIGLAQQTWAEFLQSVNWAPEDVDRVATHQVGKAHRKLLLESLDINPEIDFPTVETLGNTGSAALPIAAARSIEHQHLLKGQNLAMLGIGSGLNCLMLGVNWNGGNVVHDFYT